MSNHPQDDYLYSSSHISILKLFSTNEQRDDSLDSQLDSIPTIVCFSFSFTVLI